MPFQRLRLRTFASACGAILITVSSVVAADRVALVIGNGNYQHLQKLTACPRDAAVMAETFQKIGIRVHGGKPLVDLTADQMDRALNDFARSLGKDCEAFIYYSGHGAQFGGGNFLLPVGFDAEFESQARRQAVSLDSILELLERTEAKLRVVILDACRDPGNLLPGEPKQKGIIRKGLNEQHVEAPETLVCFATKHGQPSLADDKASYYTAVLAEEIVKPAELGAVMRKVASRVYAATETRQLPFTYGSLLKEHFLSPDGLLGDLERATKDAPFVNSLGMKFVPVPNTRVLFSIWDTRVQDFKAFANANKRAWSDSELGPTEPAVNVSWKDARAFCAWLSVKEGRAYRLPTDEEWSAAVGVGKESGATPEEKSGKLGGYPWGPVWPPPKGAGNLADESGRKGGAIHYIKEYNDGHPFCSPVGAFSPNAFGLYDMGGNVLQWCEDWYNGEMAERVSRGSCWFRSTESNVRSSYRTPNSPEYVHPCVGFRCVLALPGG